MNTNHVVKLKEAELYPMAKKYFVSYSQLDLEKEKHRRMMLNAENARLAGLSGIDIRAVISYWDGSYINDGKITKDDIDIECKSFSQIPQGDVKRIYAFVVTVGECIYKDEDPITTQLFADTWGTAYVDVARIVLEQSFKTDMELTFGKDKLSLSSYFGPGFYGIPMEETIKLCNMLSADDIGVRAKDNGLMIPVKSSSGFYLAVSSPKSLPKRSCEECIGNSKGCAYCLSSKK